MKKTFIVTFLALLSMMNIELNAQELTIKASFDAIFETHVMGRKDLLTDIDINPDHAFKLSVNIAPSLEGLLVMYEETNDREYLWKFMDLVCIIMELRLDKTAHYTTAPVWFYNPAGSIMPNQVNTVFNGRVIAPLAHFVYIVKNDWYLKTATIPNSSIYDYGNHGFTYGDWADWLLLEVKTTVDFCIMKLWRNRYPVNCSNGPFEGMDHSLTNPRTGCINFQAPWGATFLYLYLSSPSTMYNYGVYTAKIAKLFFGQACAIGGSSVFNYVSEHNAYYMLHDPWRGLDEHYFTEDTRHGSWTIWFAGLYNKYKTNMSHVTGIKYFEDYHMVRFRNMFTNMIYEPGNYSGDNATYIQTGGFWISTRGREYISVVEFDTTSGVRSLNLRCKNNPLPYAVLSKFDNVSGTSGIYNAYDAIKGFYLDEYVEYNQSLPNIPNTYDPATGLYLKGLADLYSIEKAKSKKLSLNIVEDNYSNIEDTSLSIYPNPVIKDLSFLNPYQGTTVVKIIDMQGNTFYESAIYYGQQKIDLSSRSNGVYILRLYSQNGEIKTSKFVIE